MIAPIRSFMAPVAFRHGGRFPTFRRVFGAPTRILAWIVIVGSFIHPPHGTGLPICWLNRISDIECPGCGMTRSISCVSRGMLDEAVAYNPFGPVFLAGFVLIAAVSLLPRRRQLALAILMERHKRPIDVLFGVFITVFIGFGAVRAIGQLGLL